MLKETIFLGRYTLLCSSWFVFLGEVSSFSSASQGSGHLFAITIFEDSIYWTDRNSQDVRKANKWHGGNESVVLSASQPLGIVAVHPARQPTGK